jgi:KUP system potassium uptake protein
MEGEGGSFALFQALYPPDEKNLDEDRTLSGESHFGKSKKVASTFKEKARWPLLLWCLFGTSLTMADGIFTPAISVTSAVGGIAVAKPSTNNDIIPISIAFLFALFFIQQFGTHRLAFAFSPASFIWFLLLIGTGIYNITFFPGIFRAFDPSRAVLLFVRTKDFGILSGVLLAVTGCEAMFANLGQFNAFSIRLSFCTFVYPALVLAYLGQGARLIHDGTAILPNVFYNSIPGHVNGPLYWIVFVFAILATLIASQAMITATFSLVQQVIHSRAFPPIQMVYTSKTIQGQIYIPAFNWALMIATIVIVAVFKNLENLSNAYGFAVSTVMFTTSCLIAIQIPAIKNLPIFLGVAYFLSFGFFDALFWGAAFRKVPHGAWVPLLIGIVLLSIMWLWVWAKRLEDEFDGQNRMNLRHFIYPNKKSQTDDDISSEDDYPPSYYYTMRNLSDVPVDEKMIEQRREIQRIPTFAIFHKLTPGKGIPHTFVAFVRQWPALPRVVVFLSVCIVPLPNVPPEERYIVTKVRTVEGFYGATYYIGFRDDFDVKSEDLVERICAVERQLNPGVSEALVQGIRSAAETTTHIAPHYHVVSRKVHGGYISPVINYLRRILIEGIYRRLGRFSSFADFIFTDSFLFTATMFPETANWLTPADEIIHVGINAII